METISVTVRYRPIRIGWCVRKNDLAALRESWRLSSTMWGGIYNPIIPVDDVDYARALVELFRVDFLWPASNDAAVKSFIEAFPYLPNPLFHDQLFVPHGNGTQSAAILDIYHPIRRFYDEHFKNNPNPELKVVVYDWAQEDPLSDIWLSTFGAVPSKDVTGTDYLALLEKYLAAERIAIGPEDPWPVGSKDRWSLSGLGRSGIQRHYSVTNHWGHPGFYFGSSGDFEDLVNYWNLRATDTHVIFFDPLHADRFDGIRVEWLEVLRARPKGRFESDNTIAIWSKDRDEQRDLSAFGEGLRICTIDAGVWNGLNVKAPYMYFSEGSSLATVGVGTGQPRVSFQLPPKPFFEDTWNHDQQLVISVDPGIGLFGNERATLVTPYIPELNEFYGRNFYFEWDKARVEPDGLGIIAQASRSDFSLNAIDVSQLVEKIFGVAGIVATPSKPGLIAARLIQQMGGLQKCRPFKIGGVRDLIEKFGPDKPFTHSGAVQTIRAVDSNGSVGFTQYEDMFIEERPLRSKLTPDAVLSYLMKKDVFRAGLEFDCPSCRLQFWTSLDDISTETTCEYCGHRFNITPYLRHRGDWRFRRSGLFGRNDNQEGAIPVVLTLQQLDTLCNSREMLYTTAMELNPGATEIQKCETDFVAIVQKPRDGRIQIAIGECKTRKPITEDDITKLKSVTTAFPSGRFDVFVILAKLTQFTQEEIKYAAMLNDEYHRRAILLTARELEPYHLYERTAKEFNIDRIAVSFEDMANITHQIYFQPTAAPLT